MGNAQRVLQPPKLSPDGRYLTDMNGKPFFWLADTWWFAATKRMSESALKVLLHDRAKKGFTVILLVIGAPPEVDPFSVEAGNEGGCAFLQNGGLNTHYFDHADGVIRKILAAGMFPCIVGSWGHHIDRFGVETMKHLWLEITNRWGDLPVIYCVTAEADVFLQGSALHETISSVRWGRLFRFFNALKIVRKLFRTAAGGQSEEIRRLLATRVEKWDEVARYIRQIDKHAHLLTVHLHRKLLASELFHHPGWLDIDTIQSGHTKSNAGFMVEAARRSCKKRPFINLEPWYEGILGNFGPSDQRYAFWACILSGAKGHTYGAHGIWQMATRSDPFLAHWGISDWQEAIRYEGAKQIGLAKQWLMKIPWWKLTPDIQATATEAETITPYEPFVAHINNQYVLAYFPKGRKNICYRLNNFSTHHTYSVTYISPVTMLPQREETFTNQRSYSMQAPLSKDWLVCISRFDEKTEK
ncbi:MAG: hypothetical protein UW52_C0006G0002 [Candidatus Gottesmanbacteria bacterium GW2011_GWA1_44_24b]|uniref:Apiosidase-like catalytic domain-containing protein n=1 Tax=Candidatus Gottesmanbacteria bacterium GW2011_GWA1_44_24b TaxID=1618437 RepID=A0A0G1IPI1_9BACT|nr:MAG: hypothetical protein UW52_C0006G0002 [Candidatus Gottesmanbacteria bacterium GW2011_GWA1_44_24b]